MVQISCSPYHPIGALTPVPPYAVPSCSHNLNEPTETTSGRTWKFPPSLHSHRHVAGFEAGTRVHPTIVEICNRGYSNSNPGYPPGASIDESIRCAFYVRQRPATPLPTNNRTRTFCRPPSCPLTPSSKSLSLFFAQPSSTSPIHTVVSTIEPPIMCPCPAALFLSTNDLLADSNRRPERRRMVVYRPSVVPQQNAC